MGLFGIIILIVVIVIIVKVIINVVNSTKEKKQHDNRVASYAQKFNSNDKVNVWANAMAYIMLSEIKKDPYYKVCFTIRTYRNAICFGKNLHSIYHPSLDEFKDSVTRDVYYIVNFAECDFSDLENDEKIFNAMDNVVAQKISAILKSDENVCTSVGYIPKNLDIFEKALSYEKYPILAGEKMYTVTYIPPQGKNNW